MVPSLLDCRRKPEVDTFTFQAGSLCPSLRVGVRQAILKAGCGLQGLLTDLMPLLNLEIGNITLGQVTE